MLATNFLERYTMAKMIVRHYIVVEQLMDEATPSCAEREAEDILVKKLGKHWELHEPTEVFGPDGLLVEPK